MADYCYECGNNMSDCTCAPCDYCGKFYAPSDLEYCQELSLTLCIECENELVEKEEEDDDDY